MGYSFKKLYITITNAFQKILDKSICKANKISIYKAANFIIDQ